MNNPLSKLLNFYKSRNFVKAEKEYLNIVKKVKPNHELLNLYGVILFELKKYDCTIIVTDHSNVNYNLINKHSKMIIDTRNVYKVNSKKILKF